MEIEDKFVFARERYCYITIHMLSSARVEQKKKIRIYILNVKWILDVLRKGNWNKNERLLNLRSLIEILTQD